MDCCASRPKKPNFTINLANKHFVTLGRGVGGIDELAQSLDESKVVWGLTAVKVGSGGLARTKFVFMYFSGAKCPMVKRMRYTEKRGAAIEACGGGGMIEWDREHVADVTLDEMLGKVLAAVVSDDGGADTSVGALRAQALEEIKKASEQVQKIAAKKKRGLLEKMGSSLKQLATGGPQARTAKAMRDDFTMEEALALVTAPAGAFNWLLVTPELQLIEAGGGSIPEMRRFLPAEGVAFALVRMGFGAGKYRRNHFLFVHWASETCPHVKRGMANAKKDKVRRTIDKSESLEVLAQSAVELGLDDVVPWMAKRLVVDGDSLTLADFEAALVEDNQALAAEFGVSAEPEPEPDEAGEPAEEEAEEELPVSEAVRSVRDAEEPYNWVLIGPK